jgi:hypothetical protein
MEQYKLGIIKCMAYNPSNLPMGHCLLWKGNLYDMEQEKYSQTMWRETLTLMSIIKQKTKIIFFLKVGPRKLIIKKYLHPYNPAHMISYLPSSNITLSLAYVFLFHVAMDQYSKNTEGAVSTIN